MKTAVILVVIAALVAATVIGVWYYKTMFYVPDKDGMVYSSTNTNNQGDD